MQSDYNVTLPNHQNLSFIFAYIAGANLKLWTASDVTVRPMTQISSIGDVKAVPDLPKLYCLHFQDNRADPKSGYNLYWTESV